MPLAVLERRGVHKESCLITEALPDTADLERVCSGVDVAVKTEAQLAEPAPLIANYEMVRSPVVVWGDERVVSSLGDVDIADIPNTESLKLVHNRMTEALLLRPTEAPPAGPCLRSLASLYGTAKLVLDLISAHLFIRNNVPTGYDDRVTLFVSDVLERRESASIRTGLEEFKDELHAWSAFKTTGDLAALMGFLGDAADETEPIGLTSDTADEAAPVNPTGATGGADAVDRLADRAWNRYIRYAEVFWRDILGDVTRTNAGAIPIDRIGSVYRRLESFPRSLGRHVRPLPGRHRPFPGKWPG